MIHQHLFLDFEFTMPDLGGRSKSYMVEIIEVGIVSVVGNKVQDTYRSFVIPEIHPILSERCKAFLNIKQEDVDQGITFRELIQVLQKYTFIEQTQVVTWGNMDMMVLKKCCQHWNIPFPFQKKELDLSLDYMKFYGERNQTGLMKALKEYGETVTEYKHHRALDDALTTYEIFKLLKKDKEYLQKHEGNRIGDFIDLTSLISKLA